MKYPLYAFLLLLSISSRAQDNYELIEKTSKLIADYQYSANGKVVTINDDLKLYLSFSKTNFVTYLKDFSATSSVYLQYGSAPDTLYLIEDIPLQKASAIYKRNYNVIEEIILEFPNPLRRKLIVNGSIIKTEQINTVSLFATSQNGDKLFIELGYLIHLIKEQKNTLTSGQAKSIKIRITDFFDANLSLDQLSQKLKPIESANNGIYNTFFKELRVEIDNLIVTYAKNRTAYKVLLARVEEQMGIASKSYENYNHYYIIDTMTTAFLSNYYYDDFEGNEYSNVIEINKNAKYRYKWNKEYANNLSKVNAYDKKVVEQKIASAKASKALFATFNTGAYIRTFSLVFGGMVGAMGAYGKWIDKDEIYHPNDIKNMLYGGGGAVVSSLLWSGIIHSRIKIRNNKLEKIKNQVKQREDEIKTLLEKRLEKRNDIPVIHTKK